MKRSLILIIISVVILEWFALPASGAVSLHRIAVLPFDDGSIKDRPWGNDFKLGKGIADELVTALLETGRFRLIEREQVDQVLAEQNLGKDGLLDPQTAARIGKILGVQYLVIGRVTEFSYKKDNDVLGNPNHNNPMGMMITANTARVAIDARLVDTSSAEILTSVTGSGQKKTVNLGIITKQGGMSFGDKDFKESDIGKALRQAITSVARQLAVKAYDGTTPLTITGMIAYVNSGRIIINVGKRDGVEPGMVFRVSRKLATLKDPSTGQVTGEATEPVAEIMAMEVKEKSATCNIVTKLSDKYQLAVEDLIESKAPVKLVLPDLPPLEQESGPRKGNEFKIYCDRMVYGQFSEEGVTDEADGTIGFLGGQMIFGRYKLAGEKATGGEIETVPAQSAKISELKFGYNLNPDQDAQIELFLSDFNMELQGGTETLECSSLVFGADVEYEMAEKTYFELSYGYGASIDLKVNGAKKSGPNLAVIKSRISYYLSNNTAVYAGYRSYAIKRDIDQDLAGFTAGLTFKF